jgi:hypothetical protein
VTQPSQRGPAQPMWAELGPAPKTKKIKINKKIKNKKIESVEIKILHVFEKKYIFVNLFTDIRIMNKKGKRKENILIFW